MLIKGKLYDFPDIYEKVFDFRNVKKDVEGIEKIIANFSDIKVGKVLEVACGNSPYMAEFSKRKIKFYGLDINEKMIKFSREKAKKSGIKAKFFVADMFNFDLKMKFDLIFCLLGSLRATSNLYYLQHFKCIQNHLKKGGLYIIESFPNFSTLPKKEMWREKRRTFEYKCIYERKVNNLITQQAFEIIKVLFINKKRNEKFVLEERNHFKLLFPEELKLLLEQTQLRFVCFLESLSKPKQIEKIKKEKERIVCLLKKE